MRNIFLRIILTLLLAYLLALMIFILGDIFIWNLSRYTRILFVLIFTVIPFIFHGMAIAVLYFYGVDWTEQEEMLAQKILCLARISWGLLAVLSVGSFVIDARS